MEQKSNLSGRWKCLYKADFFVISLPNNTVVYQRQDKGLLNVSHICIFCSWVVLTGCGAFKEVGPCGKYEPLEAGLAVF